MSRLDQVDPVRDVLSAQEGVDEVEKQLEILEAPSIRHYDGDAIGVFAFIVGKALSAISELRGTVTDIKAAELQPDTLRFKRKWTNFA